LVNLSFDIREITRQGISGQFLVKKRSWHNGWMPCETASVVIIGAGIVGSSIAYHLSARGCRDVIVLEKAEREAAGSTARSAAGVRHQFASEVNIRLSMYSIERLKRFRDEVGGEAGLKQIGYLLLVSEPEVWLAYRRSVELQNSLGVDSRAITPGEVLGLVPETKIDGLLGATYCAADGHCDPHGIASGYLAAARRQGIGVRRATPAVAVRRSGDRVTAVETPAGAIECGVVINAAGPWAGEVGALAGVAVPVRPYRRCIYMTEAMPELEEFPFTIDTASGFYMRKEGDKLLMGVSNEDEPAGENLSVDWDWLETVLERGAERFPFLANVGIVRRNCWAGLYENTPDHMPVLGRRPELPNYVDASGFSGHGVMHSPATGMLIAEEVLDGRAHTIDIDELRVTRFDAPMAKVERNVY
jgi:sarcosine oxidase subunit beta